MTIDKLREFDFKNGIYVIDTRSFRITKTKMAWLPTERFYILDSDPLTYEELLKFLTIIKEKSEDFTRANDWSSDVVEGFWPLKYLYVIYGSEDRYYILSRYYKRINWKKILTV